MTSCLPGHPVALPDVRVEVAHPGAAVAADGAAEGLLPRVHPESSRDS